MTKPVCTVSPTAAADDAWNLMRAQRVRHLVVSDHNRVVGVLSDRDAGGAADPQVPHAAPEAPSKRRRLVRLAGRRRPSGLRRPGIQISGGIHPVRKDVRYGSVVRLSSPAAPWK